MGRGGSPVEPGSFWRDATSAGPDYNDNDHGFDDPSAGPGESGGHCGSRGCCCYGTTGRDDYVGHGMNYDISDY
jgi:hypothetical protein